MRTTAEPRRSQTRTAFLADWIDVLFMHFRVPAASLQRLVPLELELFAGCTYLSLVAFTQKRLRPAIGGRLAALLAAPLAEHEFLNLRTYVRRKNERGIYFLAEWIPNRLAELIGPRLYGLPYRLGQLRYNHASSQVWLHGEVQSRGRWLSYDGQIQSPATISSPRPLDEFLLERYVAFTCREGVVRRFEVAHEPWTRSDVTLRINDRSLVERSGAWCDDAVFAGANFSPGVRDVAISFPTRAQ